MLDFVFMVMLDLVFVHPLL